MVRRRGIALIIVLLLMLVLLSMAKSLTLLTHGEAFRSLRYYQRTNSLFVADAAVADVKSELAANPDWAVGYSSKSMNSVRGNYSVEFNSTGAGFTPLQSVNNLTGTSEVPGPRGPVAARTVDLLVRVNVGGVSRQVRVLLGAPEAGALASKPLMSSGKIRLSGDILIDGITSFDDPQPLPAGIHSNDPTDAPDRITWDGSGTASITGSITSTSTNAGAINVSGATPAGGISMGTPSVGLRAVDIVATVAEETGLPPPTFGAGAISGRYYNGGSVTLMGDLHLDDGTIYIEGDLTVNGSISGEGSLFVTGETQFLGDSAITTNSPEGVALYSHGHVHLSGFDGSSYLDQMAGLDPGFATAYVDAQSTLNEMQTLVNASPPADLVAGGPQNALFETMRRTMGQAQPGAVVPGRVQNALGVMVGHLQARPPDSARDFLVERLTNLQGFFESDISRPASAIIAEWMDTDNDFGVLNAALDEAHIPSVQRLTTLLNELHYDRLGTSYFKGLIYTNGSLYAAHEVDILGAIVVEDDGSQVPTSLGLDVLNPGDLYLSDGVSVTFIEELVDAGFAAGFPPGTTEVRVWLDQ